MATKMVFICSCGNTYDIGDWPTVEDHINNNPTHTVAEGYAHTSVSGVPRQIPVETGNGDIFRVTPTSSGGISSESDLGTATKLPKSRLSASTNPDVDDDATEGYEIGSRWINEVTGEEFVCFDNTIGNAVWGSTTESGGGSGVWGTDAAYAESLSTSITTSTTYQNKIILNVNATAFGTYRVGWSYKWNADTTSFDFLARLTDGASTTYWEHVQEPQDSAGDFDGTGSDQQHQAGGFFYLDLTAGAHTFVLQWASGSNGNEASIWNAALEFWRHS